MNSSYTVVEYQPDFPNFFSIRESFDNKRDAESYIETMNAKNLDQRKHDLFIRKMSDKDVKQMVQDKLGMSTNAIRISGSGFKNNGNPQYIRMRDFIWEHFSDEQDMRTNYRLLGDKELYEKRASMTEDEIDREADEQISQSGKYKSLCRSQRSSKVLIDN